VSPRQELKVRPKIWLKISGEGTRRLIFADTTIAIFVQCGIFMLPPLDASIMAGRRGIKPYQLK
jgi:hypothetical protein